MAAICAGCSAPIVDRFLLQVSDLLWHPGCVRCTDCGSELSDRCYVKEEKLFCRHDFFRRFGRKCSGCGLGISPTDLIHRAKDHVLHVGCITCFSCHRLLETGDRLILYSLKSNKLPVAAGLKNTAEEQPVPHLEASVVLTCENEECMRKAASADCHDDADPGIRRRLLRQFTSAAAMNNNNNNNTASSDLMNQLSFEVCSLMAQEHELDLTKPAARHSAQHPNLIGTVMEAAIKSTAVQQAFSDQQPTNFKQPSSWNPCCETPSTSEAALRATSGTAIKSEEEHRLTGSLVEITAGIGHHDADNTFFPEDGCGTSAVSAGCIRRREPRTKIKTKQLDVLKAAFAATPKPNRHTREQLARDTGLNMRVIQVWFQNRRSKERRMKRLSNIHPGNKKPGLYRQHKEFWRTVRGVGSHCSAAALNQGNLNSLILAEDFKDLNNMDMMSSSLQQSDMPHVSITQSNHPLPYAHLGLELGFKDDQDQFSLLERGLPSLQLSSPAGSSTLIEDGLKLHETGGTPETWLTQKSSFILHQDASILQEPTGAAYLTISTAGEDEDSSETEQRHFILGQGQGRQSPSSFPGMEPMPGQPGNFGSATHHQNQELFDESVYVLHPVGPTCEQLNQDSASINQ